jgi:peptidylprolyl isomerase
MADVTPKWDATRIFILVIVVVFAISSLALSAWVIWDQVTNKDSTAQTDDAAAGDTATDVDCTMATPVASALAAPEVFKPSGDVTALETTDITPGDGAAVVAGDCIVAKYYGTLASDGTMFDENFTQATGLQFQVGIGQVIPGWDEGLIGMKVGGTRRLVIPSDKAYGDQGSGSIPANSDLVFVVKLESIK